MATGEASAVTQGGQDGSLLEDVALDGEKSTCLRDTEMEVMTDGNCRRRRGGRCRLGPGLHRKQWRPLLSKPTQRTGWFEGNSRNLLSDLLSTQWL